MTSIRLKYATMVQLLATPHSLSTLAQKLDLCESTMRNWVKELRDEGVCHVCGFEPATRPDRRGKNLYKLCEKGTADATTDSKYATMMKKRLLKGME
jgi:predicted ArsR family transcriptional regulator